MGATAATVDLYGDWIELIRVELRKRGHTPPTDPEQTTLRFFELARREIPAKPRDVQRARDLSFPAPYEAALQEIERKAISGEDLMPHLSRRLHDLQYDDPLLNDWGLHHLHLSTKVEPDGFVTRTGPVLFARVTEDRFLMIAILDHGKGSPQPWAKKLLLEKVLENWPDQLKRIPGVCGLLDQPAEQEHLQLRKRVVLAVQLSDGHVYAPLGGGATSAGTNAEATDAHDHWAYRLKAMEKWVRGNVETLRSRLQPGQTFGEPPHFKLGFHDGRVCIVETTARVAFALE